MCRRNRDLPPDLQGGHSPLEIFLRLFHRPPAQRTRQRGRGGAHHTRPLRRARVTAALLPFCAPPPTPPSRAASSTRLLYAIRARTAYGLRRAPSWRRYCNLPAAAALHSSTAPRRLGAVSVPFLLNRCRRCTASAAAGVVGVDTKMPKFRYLCASMPYPPRTGLRHLFCVCVWEVLRFCFCFLCLIYGSLSGSQACEVSVRRLPSAPSFRRNNGLLADVVDDPPCISTIVTLRWSDRNIKIMYCDRTNLPQTIKVSLKIHIIYYLLCL